MRSTESWGNCSVSGRTRPMKSASFKKTASMPIYEPDREHAVFENVKKINRGRCQSATC